MNQKFCEMKIITALLLTIMFFISGLSAQNANEMLLQSASADLLQQSADLSESLPYYTFNKGKKGNVKGTKFLDDNWQDGVILSTGDKLYNAQMRYDAVNDEVEIFNEGKSKALSPEKVKGVRIGDLILISYPAVLDNAKSVSSTFLEVLVEGEASLYKRRFAIVEEIYEVRPTEGKVPTGDVKIVHKEHYYYATKERPAARLKTNKNSVMDVLSRHRKAVARHAKENELSPKDEKDLIALFQFYNEKS